MLRLPDRSPRWIELPRDVRVLATPPGGSLRAAAVSVATGRVAEMSVDVGPEHRKALLWAFFVEELARHCITDWSGVDAPLTPANAALLMDVDGMLEPFAVALLEPLVALDAEKNGSGVAPSGILATAPDTAPVAEVLG